MRQLVAHILVATSLAALAGGCGLFKKKKSGSAPGSSKRTEECAAAGLVATPTYKGDVQPFLEAHCIGCHSGSATIPGDFTTYAGAKAAAAKIAVRIGSDDDPMPQTGKLPTETITPIVAWAANGAPSGDDLTNPDEERADDSTPDDDAPPADAACADGGDDASEDDEFEPALGPFSIDTPVTDFSGAGDVRVGWNAAQDATHYSVSIHRKADCDATATWSNYDVKDIYTDVPGLSDGIYWACATAFGTDGLERNANNNPHKFVVARLTYDPGSLVSVRVSADNKLAQQHWGYAPDAADVGAHVVGDFDGDARQDVAIWNRVSGAFSVGESSGRLFYFTQWATFAANVNWSFHVGDVNADGLADIIAIDPATADFWVGVSDGLSFAIERWADYDAAAGWRLLDTGDFDGDGKTDVIGWTTGVTWFVGLSSGSTFNITSWGQWNVSVTWEYPIVLDVNGDGKTDVVARTDANNWAGISNGTAFTPELYAPWNNTVTWSAPWRGDFDGNGADDLLVSTFVTGAYNQFWTVAGNKAALDRTKLTFQPSPYVAPATQMFIGRFDSGNKDDLMLVTSDGTATLLKGSKVIDANCCLAEPVPIGHLKKPDGTLFSYRLPVVIDADDDGQEEVVLMLKERP